MKRKAQIGMLEMIMVVIVLSVLIMIGMFYYFKFFAGSVETLSDELNEQKLQVLFTSIDSMSEIRCNDPSSNCIDIVKLFAFTKVEKANHIMYYETFGRKRIYVEQVYPIPEDSKECSVSDFISDVPCGKWIIYDNLIDVNKQPVQGRKESLPVSLYHPDKDLHTAGKLVVEVEE